MIITPRQREFLVNLIDLYHQSKSPIHYTAVAEKLGVSKWSAYDMMKLLEQKGLAVSEYVIEASQSAGRSMVVFRPTSEANALLTELAGEPLDQREWDEVKEKILANIESLKGTDYYGKVLSELLQTLSTHESPLSYCAKLMTALLLNVKNIRQKVREIPLFKSIIDGTFPTQAQLMTLAGLSIGLSLGREVNEELTSKFTNYLKVFETYIRDMDAIKQRMLSNFLYDLVSTLAAKEA